jgi:hypothetical protein
MEVSEEATAYILGIEKCFYTEDKRLRSKIIIIGLPHSLNISFVFIFESDNMKYKD